MGKNGTNGVFYFRAIPENLGYTSKGRMYFTHNYTTIIIRVTFLEHHRTLSNIINSHVQLSPPVHIQKSLYILYLEFLRTSTPNILDTWFIGSLFLFSTSVVLYHYSLTTSV